MPSKRQRERQQREQAAQQQREARQKLTERTTIPDPDIVLDGLDKVQVKLNEGFFAVGGILMHNVTVSPPDRLDPNAGFYIVDPSTRMVAEANPDGSITIRTVVDPQITEVEVVPSTIKPRRQRVRRSQEVGGQVGSNGSV